LISGVVRLALSYDMAFEPLIYTDKIFKPMRAVLIKHEVHTVYESRVSCSWFEAHKKKRYTNWIHAERQT
jgi:hypothetical protein